MIFCNPIDRAIESSLISHRLLIVTLICISCLIFLYSDIQIISAQLITPQDWIKYQKQSSYIKEFKIPLNELGLKGITTDPEGNVWLYHSTNKTSTILMFDPNSKEYRQFDVEGATRVDNSIISLTGGQLIFDDTRNAV
jgi:hypothetical protein